MDWLALSVFVAVETGRLGAQVRLRGIAYDSLAGRPLAGATILLQGFPRTALTDSAGGFVLDSVPPGRYLVILTHPELDEIGLHSVVTEAALSEAGSRDIAIAVPSLGTLWRRLCGQDSIGADSGIVLGAARDADTDSLVAGVYIDVAWPVLVKPDPKHDRVQKHSATARSDGTGSYRLCGIGTDIRVRAQARSSAVATGIVEFIVAPRPVARRDFTLSRAVRTAGDSAAGARELRGQVRSEGGMPIPSAMVTVEGADS